MLIKNILETSGYLVTTAIDGVDGFNKLKAGTFDLVVSDVDMPRMNGLDLTAKIRADKVVAEIPVILVTSLSRREDQERGLEVGANAYIVKGNFDQSNLTEVVARLIGN
jgi:two-component system chemotaxis sensor kinase CheA